MVALLGLLSAQPAAEAARRGVALSTEGSFTMGHGGRKGKGGGRVGGRGNRGDAPLLQCFDAWPLNVPYASSDEIYGVVS